MATNEINGLLHVKDESGNVSAIYPVTKAENVEGLDVSSSVVIKASDVQNQTGINAAVTAGWEAFSAGKSVIFFDSGNYVYQLALAEQDFLVFCRTDENAVRSIEMYYGDTSIYRSSRNLIPESSLSSTSTNPVQNKVIKAELDKMLPKSGGTMTGNIAMGSNKITGLATPTATADAATKGYVDSAIGDAIGGSY